MKHRFRNYVRQGWTVVEVPRQNLYDWDSQHTEAVFGNQKHYRDICAWCAKSFGDGAWVATMHPPNTLRETGVKRFAFKHPKHAMLFTIKWC